ncbi:hypothetical protein ADILRU_1036 [Leifsonia rubra CMS 76R]|nr:hypothetical protein ADILRU_1036 [Leifsonia rubra CMS 76R]
MRAESVREEEVKTLFFHDSAATRTVLCEPLTRLLSWIVVVVFT